MTNAVKPIALLLMLFVLAGGSNADVPAARDVAAARETVRQLVHPTPMSPDVVERITRLTEGLGADLWRLREDATRDLLQIGPRARPLVEKVLSSPDLEARTRAEQVLQGYRQSEQNTGSVLSAAADVLAAAKDKWVVEALLGLLDHKDVDLRYAAEYALRRIVGGEEFGYNAYAEPAVRTAAVEKWRTWWEQHREGFQFPQHAGPDKAAGVLVSDATARKVEWIDLDGKILWAKSFPTHAQPFSAEALPNGNTFIVLRMQGLGMEGRTLLAEYGHKGSVLAMKGAVQDVRRLPNGNTLMPHASGQSVIELDATGKNTIWEFACSGAPRSIERLANGNTLIAVYPPGKVIEVTRAGQVVWEQMGIMPLEAAKLPNGNVLVVEQSQRIVEIDRKGGTAWTWSSAGGQPTSACRMSDGQTVVYDRTLGVILVDKSARVIRTLSKSRPELGEKIRPAPPGYHPPQPAAPKAPGS